MLNKLITWWRNRRNFVILDVNDSSVTLSRNVFKQIQKTLGADCAVAKIFVFHIRDVDSYGFVVNPPFMQPAQLADIQYNTRHHCVGFETLNPTVAKILYDYEIPRFMKPCRFTVTKHDNLVNIPYWQIERPFPKSNDSQSPKESLQ